MAFSSSQTLVAQLFQAAYTRAPSSLTALDAWVARYDANIAGGATAAESQLTTITEMVASAESTTVYGSLDADATVVLLWSNSLGRAFSDAAAQKVWADFFTANGLAATINAMVTTALTGANSATDSATLVNAAAAVDAAFVAAAAAGTTFTLTTANDTFIGTDKNDTFTSAAGTLGAADTLIDQSSTDSDVANITLTAAGAAAKISGVEAVNYDWNAFGTATIDAANISGATITVSSTKVGFLGSATVNNAKANTITAGAGAKGTLTIGSATQSVVNAGEAKTVSATSDGTAATSISVTAGASTTSITTADFNTTTVDAGTSVTTISLTDDDAAADQQDTGTLTFGKSATLTNNVDDLVVTPSAAGLTLTLANTVITGGSLDIAGTNAMTLKIATSTLLTADVVTKSSTGSVTLSITDHDGATDLSKVAVDLISVAAAGTGGAITVKSGQALEFTTNLANATGVTVGGAGTADTATVTTKASQGQILTFTGIETTTIATNAPVSTTAVDVTLAEINAGTNKVMLSGANDVTVTLAEAKTFDATALTNTLVITQDAAADMDISGSTTKTTATFKGTTHTNNYVGQDGTDIVTFATTTGSAVAVVGGGANTITATSLTTTANLVVVGGSGVDTVTATAVTDQNTTLELGAGNNKATFDLGTAKDTITVVTGDNDDSIILVDATSATDVINLTLGGGTDTLTIGAGLSVALGTLTASGLTTIQMVGGGAASTVAAGLVSGTSINVKATGTAGDIFTVVGTKAAGETIDLSSMTMDQTISKAVLSTSITGNAGNDTITGTSIADAIASGGGNDTLKGGLGVDTYTGGAGIDTIVIGTADTGKTSTTADIINVASFTSTTDKLSLGVAGSASNFLSASADGGATDLLGVAAAIVAADAAMNGTVKYYFYDNTNAGADNGYLAIDADMDGDTDDIVIVTGAATAGAIVFGDIIA